MFCVTLKITGKEIFDMNNENENILSDFGDLTAYGYFSILPFDITTLNPNQYTQLSLNTDKSSQLGFFSIQVTQFICWTNHSKRLYVKVSKRFTSYSYEIESGRYGYYTYEC